MTLLCLTHETHPSQARKQTGPLTTGFKMWITVPSMVTQLQSTVEVCVLLIPLTLVQKALISL
jgi:hypothetical protein